MFVRPAHLAAAAALAAGAAPALATWSILIADTRTGEVALASATCVPGIDLQAETPVLITGVGAVTAQSFVESRGLNRTFARDRLLEGIDPADILTGLEAFDNGHQSRQYGILDVRGGTATFSGSENSDWAGGVTGRIERGRPGPADDIVYAVQGNILVGPEPVLAAEMAIRATPGDLGQKLLAGMEAARALGGDGRCSCTTGSPTSCGSPPPEPFKSADVGYMLIARTGDRDGCPGRYRLSPTEPAAFATGDFDADGSFTLAALPRTTGRLALVEPITDPRSPIVGLDKTAEVTTLAASAIDMLAADVNDDGLDDLVLAFGNPNPRLAVLLADPHADPSTEGGFLPPVVIDLPSAPNNLVDRGNGWIAVVLPDEQAVRTYRAFEDGSFTRIDLGSVRHPIAGRGDAWTSGMVVVPSTDVDTGEPIVAGYQLTGSAPRFTLDVGPDPILALTVEIPPNPVGSALASLNAGDNTITIHTATAQGDTRADFDLSGRPIDAVVTDIDHDGDPDIVVASGAGSSTITIFTNDGELNFTPTNAGRLDGEAARLAAADLDDDGYPEILASVRTVRVTQVVNNLAGTLDLGPGCATGDYFLDLNVVAGRDAEDPVFTLRGEYDAWRAGKRGLPDAVRTKVEVPNFVPAAKGGRMLVRLRDIEGDDVVSPVGVRAEPLAPGVNIKSIVPVTPDLYEITFTTGVEPGVVPVRVTITHPAGDAVLMPDPAVHVVLSPADLDDNGVLDMTDVRLFTAAYLAADPRADIDRDGAHTARDAHAFVAAFLRP